MKSVAEDCRLDLLKGLCRRFSHQRRQAFNAEPFSTLIENLDETIGVQNQTVAGREVNSTQFIAPGSTLLGFKTTYCWF
jgi:hypothetical protein